MDLVLLSVSGTLDAARVRESIAATFRRRATHPVPAAPPPPGAGVISYRAADRTLEIRAKHEFVKNINPATESPDGPQAQSCRPGRVRPLLRDLQMELERFQRRQIQYDDLGRYAGQAARTVFNKLQKNDHPQIEGLLGWLERLPEAVRCGILGKFCRCFRSLEPELRS